MATAIEQSRYYTKAEMAALFLKLVSSGDITITDPTNGWIQSSPDTTRYRLTVANGGTPTFAAV